MNQKLSYTFGFIILVMVAFATSSAEAGGGKKGRYYATPSWDQKLACATPTNCPRFEVLSDWNNEAVLDLETGLVWERSPSTSAYGWSSAMNICNVLSIGNRIGWRLPTLQELASLVDPSQLDPSLPSGHPFNNVQTAVYWSATTLVDDPNVAWVVIIGNGTVTFGLKSFGHFVWCVRGGQGVDLQ
jgi:hypothetical protein